MLFHASHKGARRKVNEPKPWVVHLWSPRLASDSKPHLRRGLGGQFVKSEGRQQAHNAMRNPFACLCQGVVLGNIGIGQDIQASPHTLEVATLTQATEVDARDTMRVQVAGT
jgi:hypothetical protein